MGGWTGPSTRPPLTLIRAARRRPNRGRRQVDPDAAGDPDWDPGVLAPAGRRTLASQRLDHEIALGALVGLEGDGGAGADAHPRQRGTPRGHGAANQHLVGQTVAGHLDHDGRARGKLGGGGAKDAPGGKLKPVVLFELFEVPAADTQNVHEGALQEDQNSRGASDVLGFCPQCPSASTLVAPSAPPKKRRYRCLTEVFSTATASTRRSGPRTAASLPPATTSIVWNARRSGSACGPRPGPPWSAPSPRRWRRPASPSRACG